MTKDEFIKKIATGDFRKGEVVQIDFDPTELEYLVPPGSDGKLHASAFDTQVGGDHYKKLDIQPLEVMRSWFGAESFQDYLLMNALKYIARKKHDKGEDIAKAIHYLQIWQESRK